MAYRLLGLGLTFGHQPSATASATSWFFLQDSGFVVFIGRKLALESPNPESWRGEPEAEADAEGISCRNSTRTIYPPGDISSFWGFPPGTRIPEGSQKEEDVDGAEGSPRSGVNAPDVWLQGLTLRSWTPSTPSAAPSSFIRKNSFSAR